MTVLLVCSLHPFAGTSRSRRRTRFIPTPASAGRASPIRPQSGRRVWQQRSVRDHHQLPAHDDLRKLSLRKAAAASNPHSRPTARRSPAGSFIGGFRTPAPYTGPIARAGPASETLPEGGPSARVIAPRPFSGAGSVVTARVEGVGEFGIVEYSAPAPIEPIAVA